MKIESLNVFPTGIRRKPDVAEGSSLQTAIVRLMNRVKTAIHCEDAATVLIHPGIPFATELVTSLALHRKKGMTGISPLSFGFPD